MAVKMKRELWVRILMVVAPLIMLCALTIAWFVNSQVPQVSEMSFASADAGPGAAMHKTEEVKRVDELPNIISDITWGAELNITESDITIQNMVPNQCEYYLLVSNHKFSVNLIDIKLWREENGVFIETADPAQVPLAQCLAFYLIPLQNAAAIGDKKLTEAATVTFLPDPRDTEGRLNASLLAGLAVDAEDRTIPLPITGGAASAYCDAYVLAVYYDPLYQQGTKDAPRNTSSLPGKISFSLSFPDRSKEAANG